MKLWITDPLREKRLDIVVVSVLQIKAYSHERDSIDSDRFFGHSKSVYPKKING